MKTDEIRQSFLGFFEKKAHPVISSDSLVPQNDPTLLFTGAGMNQFKEYFLGLKKDMKRAASSQKCLRTGDLDEVGKTAFHHSFFEMLGNFSFGDYFKKEAIAWAWEYLTTELRIPPARLRVSVHENDDEAYAIWRNDIGLSEDRIYRMGDKSNFWPANAPKDGPNGPCGPCSEIYFDVSENPAAPSDLLDAPRFAEIWNLVFTQFDRRDGGKLEPLANKNIDTGMGLERLACVLQGKKTNFEIDIFQPIHQAVRRELGLSADEKLPPEHLYAISDHVRAIVFSLHDGVAPSNEGRGYVIRKLIRRALWHAHRIVRTGTLEGPFLFKVVPDVVKVMKQGYPELVDSQASIVPILRSEEERFLDTLETGLRILAARLNELAKGTSKTVPGEIVFELYDTYGFPEELTRDISGERGFSVDHAGFERQMQAQRNRAKQASQISGSIFVSSELEQNVLKQPETLFTGYEKLTDAGTVLFADLKDGKGVVVLDKTPFYAEGGGQVGDSGVLEGDRFLARVLDTQKKDQRFMHLVEVEKGEIKTGDRATAKVDVNQRFKTMRNHTATHLLHAALRKILGPQVRQLGSLVSPEKLRFDYSYSQALTSDQIAVIEDDVNREILLDEEVTKAEKSIEAAREEGALAFFGEKYGKAVRVLTIGSYSKELCGGTHCDRTGQIGSFVIVSDTSIASGTRRIEALTGDGALHYARQIRSELSGLAEMLKTSPASLRERIVKLQEKVKVLEKKQKEGSLGQVKMEPVTVPAGRFCLSHFLAPDGTEATQLRSFSDTIRSRDKKTVYFLAAPNADKVQYLLGMTPDLGEKLNLKELFTEISGFLEGSGGGRKDLIQGGARNNGQLQRNWKQIETAMVEYLKERA